MNTGIIERSSHKAKRVCGLIAKNNEAHVPANKVEPEEDIVDLKP